MTRTSKSIVILCHKAANALKISHENHENFFYYEELMPNAVD